MSVNRFEITPPMLCISPHALRLQGAASQIAAALIVDIRQDWAMERIAGEAQSAINRHQPSESPILLRIGMPDGDIGQSAVDRLIALRPTGFVLCGCSGVADIQKFDVMLRVAEAEYGITPGSTGLFAELGENPKFFLAAASLKDISLRLKAIIFNGESLTHATASQALNAAASRIGAPLLLGRATAVITARQAGVACYDLLPDFQDADAPLLRDIALADGFSGVIARNGEQLAQLTST